jgi:hypothetical protein
MYIGDDHQPSRSETVMRNAIRVGSMRLTNAKRIFNNIDCDLPFYSVVEFIELLAALVVLFKDEIGRKTHVNGETLQHIIWAAAAPNRVEWYFNNIRFRRTLSMKKLALLGSGTSPNESMHAELNRWMRNQPETYSATLELQLEIAHFGKLFAHNAALYHPTLRQLTQSEVVARSVFNLRYPERDWNAFCRMLSVDARIHSAHLPLYEKRKIAEVLVCDAKKLNKKSSFKKQLRKRTVYSLKRVGTTEKLLRKKPAGK